MPARSRVAKVDRWHGVGEVDPYHYFTFETFAFEGEMRQRPKSARGAFWHVGGGPRDDLFQLADLRSTGEAGALHPTFSVSGHLIAKMLGGLDVPENLVNVTKQTNDKMQRVENELKGCADPHWLKVEVLDYYDEPERDPRVPKSFRYSVWKGGVAPADTAAPIKTWNVSQEWLQIGRFDFDQKLISLASKLGAGLKFGFQIERLTDAGPQRRNLGFLAGSLPAVADRPLAILDYALLVHPETWDALGVNADLVHEYVESLGTGKSFELRWVRELAIKGNILLHDNWLISDVYGRKDRIIELSGGSIVPETHQCLIIGGGSNAPQIDHIQPESLGGSNCFSNAQVTSQQYNGQKGNTVSTLAVRSEEWKAKMLEELRKDPRLKGFV